MNKLNRVYSAEQDWGGTKHGVLDVVQYFIALQSFSVNPQSLSKSLSINYSILFLHYEQCGHVLCILKLRWLMSMVFYKALFLNLCFYCHVCCSVCVLVLQNVPVCCQYILFLTFCVPIYVNLQSWTLPMKWIELSLNTQCPDLELSFILVQNLDKQLIRSYIFYENCQLMIDKFLDFAWKKKP